MVKDDWLKSAMTDDRVVVELLVRLKQSQAASPSKPSLVIPLRWGLRLPRSKSSSASSSFRCDHDSSLLFKPKDAAAADSSATRCSPTTPLSWSGGGGAASASASPSLDGFEETSRHVPSSAVRSNKMRSFSLQRGSRFLLASFPVTAETACTTSTKRSRRKKTFAELRIEEGLLMKEKMHLTRKIETLHATFNEQRSRNEKLKRIKLDLNQQYAKNSSFMLDEIEEAICSQSNQGEPSSSNITSVLPINVKGDYHTQSVSCETQEAGSNHDKLFLLPDLNMMPSEEDPSVVETLPVMR